MNKTKVILNSDLNQGQGKKGDVGYIDGYVQGADGRPYCVVVIKNFIDLAMYYQLDVIEETTNER